MDAFRVLHGPTRSEAGTPETNVAEGAPIVGSLRLERILLLPRAVTGVGVMALPMLVDVVWVGAIVGLGMYFVAVSLVARRALATTSPHRGPFAWTSLADTAGCFGLLGVLSLTPDAPGTLLFPLLAFELALKYCVRGAALALALLTIAIAIRSVYRSVMFELEPRPWLILLMLTVTCLLLGLAGTIRANDRARVQAINDRRRLAGLLHDTVTAVLDEAKVDVSSAHRKDLLTLVEAACARPELGDEITRRLAGIVSPSARSGPLSAREAEVLELVANGLKDREIAARLFLSQGTVRVHMSNIVHKLGVADRATAVEWFRDHRSRLAANDGSMPGAEQEISTSAARG